VALGASAHAETVAAEGVGRAPLTGADRVAPRAAALEAALRAAVRSVAADLAGTSADPSGEAALDEALGKAPARFATSYRKRAEQEAKGAGGRPELVVTVDARVDRAGVAAALRRAGLLPEAAPAPFAEAQLERIVIEPVPPWPALTALRRRFVELGARRAVLALVEPGRVVIAVEGRSAETLARAAVADPPPGMRVAAAGELDGAPRLRLESAPLAPSEAPGAIDTPAAKR
jgi:hypothetical protein